MEERLAVFIMDYRQVILHRWIMGCYSIIVSPKTFLSCLSGTFFQLNQYSGIESFSCFENGGLIGQVGCTICRNYEHSSVLRAASMAVDFLLPFSQINSLKI